MKRALTVMFTVALVGSLLFAGFAGSAAAHPHNHDKADQKDKVKQTNFNKQTVGDFNINTAQVNQQVNNNVEGDNNDVRTRQRADIDQRFRIG